MIDKLLRFRNKVHKNNFRFDVAPELWNSAYVPAAEEEGKVVTVTRDQTLKGYAVYSLSVHGESKAYVIRDICADTKDTFSELIDMIVESGFKDEVDFIFVRKCEEPYNYVFDRKGFLSLVESVIMVVLLNPNELLMSLSEKAERGKILTLHLRGLAPINVRVGQNKIEVLKEGKPNLKVTTDNKTFLKLFFGSTTFMKELIKGKVVVDGKMNLLTASRFFKIIKQNRWYLPYGDWC